MAQKLMLVSILMTVMLASVLAVPAVIASSGDLPQVDLYDAGALAGSAFVFTVAGPQSVNLDDAYLNYTVSVTPVHAGYGAGHGTNATYHVQLYFNDGATNWTVDKTLAAKTDKTIWANASLVIAGAWTVANGSAIVYIQVKNSTTVEDSYQDLFGIYDNSWSQAVGDMVPVIITLGVLCVILPAFVKRAKGLGGRKH